MGRGFIFSFIPIYRHAHLSIYTRLRVIKHPKLHNTPIYSVHPNISRACSLEEMSQKTVSGASGAHLARELAKMKTNTESRLKKSKSFDSFANDAPPIVLAICAMEKKTKGKPMKEILVSIFPLLLLAFNC